MAYCSTRERNGRPSVFDEGDDLLLLELHVKYGFTYEELAEKWDCSVSSVSRKVREAKREHLLGGRHG